MKLTLLGGEVHVIDNNGQFVESNEENVLKCVENIPAGYRDAFENRTRKEILERFKIIFKE